MIEIRFAKEIKTNFLLILLSLLIALVIYVVLYFSLKPPIYEISEEKKLQLQQSIYEQSGQSVEQYGSILRNDVNRYDQGIAIECYLDNCVNEYRKSRFMKDIWRKSSLSFTSILFVLIIGRYFIFFVQWVAKTSKIK